MKISVVGTGYVGLVSGACLAEVGNDVLCLDLDKAKIAILEAGDIPIYEPGLLDMVRRNVAAGRLSFTTDIEKAVAHGTIQFIAVGTPPDEDGSADLKYVLAAARNIVGPPMSILSVATCRTINWSSINPPCLSVQPTKCAQRLRMSSKRVALKCRIAWCRIPSS